MRLEEFFYKYSRNKGVSLANKLRVELRSVLSVRAPTRIVGGRVVATTKAVPYAPPRIVTERLRKGISIVPTKNGARLVIWTPYGVPLEKSHKWAGWPHKFLSVALARIGLEGRHSEGR